MSDRVGREWVWTIGNLGFALYYLALLVPEHAPTEWLLWLMVLAQGFLGYGIVSVLSAIPAELFQGRRFGTIFGTLMLTAVAGGAVGPWLTGVPHDAAGDYSAAFWVAFGTSLVSAAAIWLAAPRNVRVVGGRVQQAQ